MRQLKNNIDIPSNSKENIDSSSHKTHPEISSGLAYPTMWKRAFAIGQNVRFTRTPEVELMRRRIENDKDFAENLSQTEMATKKLAEKAVAMREVSTKSAVINAEPIEDMQIEAAEQTELAGELVQQTVAEQTIMAKANDKTIYLSDFAFFEYAGLFETSGLVLENFDDILEGEITALTVAPVEIAQVERAPVEESVIEIAPIKVELAEINLPNATIKETAKTLDVEAEISPIMPEEAVEIAPSEEILPQVVAENIIESANNLHDVTDNSVTHIVPDALELKSLFREIACREFSVASIYAHHYPLTIPVVQNLQAEMSAEDSQDILQQKMIEQDIINQKIIEAALSETSEHAENYGEEIATMQEDKDAHLAEIMAEESPIIDMVAEDEPVIVAEDEPVEDITANIEAAEHAQNIEVAAPIEPETTIVKAEEVEAATMVEAAPIIAEEAEIIEIAKTEIVEASMETSMETSVEANVKPIAKEQEPQQQAEVEFKKEQKIVASLPKHNPAFIPKMVQKDYENYDLPTVDYLQVPIYQDGAVISQDTLERSAGLLESVLEDFGIKGEIIHVRPGPVVTLYEFEPAAGVKSSRVIGLSDDIARSMSAISARVAVIPGRNVIGIELPNSVRETVYLRELIAAKAFQESQYKLPLALGKSIGGEPVIAELAKMPHLLVAGTTGSGKSVAINTMILSLLYRLTPDECRLIMVDPKMLELSTYDGIPHLLTPVVTDPKKAVTALKWAVREMEDRYRKMAKLGVRNIDGFNARVVQAVEKGETIMCTVQSGFDKETGEMLYHEEAMDLTKLPFIVVIVDEMADLMMVAGKEIEGAIQRLAQMARAAGIHLIMATQRPSVDVITGTIKANFPTRISFQVTSKIDSRTILGEQGAETLLGQGDMLHMVGGGRIVRVHGPFVSDEEVEQVVAHLKTQGTPDYLATITDDEEDEDSIDDAASVADIVAAGNVGEDGEDLYLQAVKVVMRDKKCSTSYIQRRLSIGYNKAASLVERMEKEGIVGSANHVGKREILLNNVPKHS